MWVQRTNCRILHPGSLPGQHFGQNVSIVWWLYEMGQNRNLHNFNIVFKVHLGVRPRSTGWGEEAVLAGGRSNQSPSNVSNETKIYFLLIITPKQAWSPRAGWTRTSSTTSPAKDGSWDIFTPQTMRFSLTKEQHRKTFTPLEGHLYVQGLCSDCDQYHWWPNVQIQVESL